MTNLAKYSNRPDIVAGYPEYIICCNIYIQIGNIICSSATKINIRAFNGKIKHWNLPGIITGKHLETHVIIIKIHIFFLNRVNSDIQR